MKKTDFPGLRYFWRGHVLDRRTRGGQPKGVRSSSDPLLRRMKRSQIVYAGVLAVLYGFAFWADCAAASTSRWELARIGGDAVYDTAVWCGSTQTVVWEATSGGIYSSGTRSGAKKISSKMGEAKPFCSPDGRFIFFSDEGGRRFQAFDRKTLQVQTVPCLTKEIALSPDMKIALGQKRDCDAIRMAWNEVVPVMRPPQIVVDGFYPPTVVGWDMNAQTVWLKYKKLSVDPTQSEIFIRTYAWKAGDLSEPVSVPDSFYLARVEATGKRIYFVARNRSNELLDLYAVDTRGVPLRPRVIRHGVYRYDFTTGGTWAILAYRRPNQRQLFVGKGPEGKLEQPTPGSWDSGPRFSVSADHILLMKQDPIRGVEGPEGLPITSSVYILYKR